jgi:hypothetical protein
VNKKVEVVLSPYLTLILLYLDIHWTASFCLLHEALAAHLNTQPPRMKLFQLTLPNEQHGKVRARCCHCLLHPRPN